MLQDLLLCALLLLLFVIKCNLSAKKALLGSCGQLFLWPAIAAVKHVSQFGFLCHLQIKFAMLTCFKRQEMQLRFKW